ncbi:integration host factor, actinobacterial type [Tsukamurella pseudospumae]|uniref:Integration host factor n=1 Tax=Tsukamurella pseudospumae TaxID=239498 RepID=A0A138AEC5_9ACTN|nr:integration host factor, actinobacterial type [Tsukamurella pseudospumae]KXP08814.1 integration host factor [Tsukamurella pseudospumae]
MPLPELTPEQRARALANAAAARTARAQLKADLKSGTVTVADVLARAEDPIVGRMKVSALLEALPKVGKIKAGEIMAGVEIAPTRRVAGLGERQRAGLLAALAA